MLVSIPYIPSKFIEIMSPEKFLYLLRNHRDSIKTSKFITPALGTNSLGKVYVEYRYVPESTTSAKSRQRT